MVGEIPQVVFLAGLIAGAVTPVGQTGGVTNRRHTKARRGERPCIFCGASGPLTKEHVFPDWIRALGFGGQGWQETVVGERPDEKRHIRPAGPFSLTLKAVCRPCNNVWMSDIERQAKPLLTTMFQYQDVKVPLNEAAQCDLARWAFKTACVLANVQRDAPAIPPGQCVEFHETDQIPLGVQVWIGTASIIPHEHGLQLVESQVGPFNAVFSMGDMEGVIPGYLARFRVLNVFFEVKGLKPEVPGIPGAYIDVVTKGNLSRALLPIWPLEHPKVFWPPVESLDLIGGLQGVRRAPVEETIDWAELSGPPPYSQA
jgi:hypothetical protein